MWPEPEDAARDKGKRGLENAAGTKTERGLEDVAEDKGRRRTQGMGREDKDRAWAVWAGGCGKRQRPNVGWRMAGTKAECGLGIRRGQRPSVG